jgi:hypothetical protein
MKSEGRHELRFGAGSPFLETRCPQAACTGDASLWYSWVAHSALSPEDAHTFVSFTATGKTAGAS